MSTIGPQDIADFKKNFDDLYGGLDGFSFNDTEARKFTVVTPIGDVTFSKNEGVWKAICQGFSLSADPNQIFTAHFRDAVVSMSQIMTREQAIALNNVIGAFRDNTNW